MKPEHKRASKMLGYALTIGSAGAWDDFSYIVAVRLSEVERVALAYSALNSLDRDVAALTADASIGQAAAAVPRFLPHTDEARFWAGMANRGELWAYARAAYQAMGPKDQAAFFRHISELEV